MQTYELLVENRAVRANSKDRTLVRTSVGIDQVHVMFDSAEWLDFPIRITFAQGDDVVTQALSVSEIEDSDKWVAEATVTVPYEVIDMVGPIRVTLQGTDADGRHIITAKGSPLTVEEAGDVVVGTPPADAPTTDEWQQAYADAQTLLNEVQSIKNNLQAQLDSMVAEVRTQVTDDSQEIVDEILETYAVPATPERLGIVQIGSGLSITEEGILSASVTNGITASEQMQLRNIASLAYYCFDTAFDEYGVLKDTAKVKTSALPLSEIADGTTISVNDDGKIALALPVANEVGY